LSTSILKKIYGCLWNFSENCILIENKDYQTLNSNKMKNLLIILTFFFLFSAFRIDEKITISVFVYDQQDGKPIIGAEIKAKSNSKIFLNAHQNGAFKLYISKTEYV
jgi:hypothetical protein